MKKIFSALALSWNSALIYGLSISWPTTMNPLKHPSRSIDDCIQWTASGKLESGKFGLVRNGGTKFHEGIDIKSHFKGRNDIPNDAIYAFMDGKVVYVNTSEKASSYGCYIVLEHEYFLTLYAHLASISVKLGDKVKAGESIGVLGTSSKDIKIPRSRAHLHFEIDFQTGTAEAFQRWYDAHYKDRHPHGPFNGLNLIGVDPIENMEKLIQGVRPTDLFIGEQEAITLQIISTHVPWFIERYPFFLSKDIDRTKPIKGWHIEFTWFGLPKKWLPVTEVDPKAPSLKLISYRQSLKHKAVLRKVLKVEKNGVALGSRVINTLQKMGFKVK
ncbi:MAG: peptidoglycan DD-metalloendopeptidase family protein [Puniceicoccales bacterium]|jgi:murein DD-endopeptidase MepM/ murein hydrolase activator NlpD|nr:peptidoglycan DD-metalloendopeptidase family protein [Puniceicoccales bacterium]